MAVGYDISASASTSSAANPVGQFGNVYGGGGAKWQTYALLGVGLLLVFLLLKKRL